MIAYWRSRWGRAIPMPVKRGIADAVMKLYHERSLLKYDGGSKGYGFGDVIELTHPAAKDARQGQLYEYAITKGKGRDDAAPGELLETLAANRGLRAFAPEYITHLASKGELAPMLADAGMTWEALPSLINGPWTAELWEAMIPSMGVMAIMRNLRNFDQAGVSKAGFDAAVAKLTDAEQVARSRVLPMRALAAYDAVNNVRWHAPLEELLTLTLQNIPALDGNTLILVDRSGSMFGRVSDRSKLNYADSAAIFGSALALRAEKATLVQFGTTAQEIAIPKGGSVLPMLNKYRSLGGTDTVGALERFYNGHDRVVILTDEQYTRWSGGYYGRSKSPGDVIPAHVPLHSFNLAGYEHGQAGGPNRHTYAGLSDASWALVPLVEAGVSGVWPWTK